MPKEQIRPASAAYWRETLGDATAVDLWTDVPHPPVQSHRGATHHLRLGADLAQRLRSLGQQVEADLPAVLLAGLLVLLGRYQGRTDALVGLTTGGANTVVLRAGLAGPLRPRELVARVAAGTAAARTHEVPFEDLVDLLAGADDPSRHPICQVGFEAVPGPVQNDPVAIFDLKWTIHDDTRDLPCAVQYATDLWLPATVERLAQAWLQVLHAMAMNPDGPLDDLGLVTPAELVRLNRWNDTARPLPGTCTVDGLVQRWALRTPDRVALTEGTTGLTYAELVGQAAQVAQTLIGVGVGPDSQVGLHLPRGADLVVGMLGVLKAGGSYLVLDPSHPAERLDFMVRDCRVTAVLTGTDVPPWLPATGVPAIALASTARRSVTSAAEPRSLPGALAAVMYTSGSTGRPKGVGVEHRGIVRLITETDYVTIGPDDLLVHLGDPSFDITLFEVWGALCNGARVEVLPGGEQLGPEEVLALLGRLRPTVLALTSTLFNRVVDLDAGAFGGLRYLFVVGEVMDPGRSRQVLRDGPPGHLINGYGPTENTTFSTCHRITDLPERGGVPIGRPIANTTLHVVDQQLRLVPIGFPGELYVGGAGLARGYLDRPALTAERFVPDPFGAVPGLRLYRTGDLVRWRADGAMEFLGRIDQQVKVRGYRIETGEIEAALLATGTFRECVVRLVQVSGDNRLVAYLVGREGQQISVDDLLAQLRRRLPAFMLPNHFIALDRLPTTVSGKLDVRALPGVPASLQVSPVGRVAPRNPLERQVWEIWAELLGVREFGVHDNFFLLGGHSLLAIVVVTEIGSQFGVDVPARVIFQTRTVAGLAAEIEQRRRERPGSPPDEVDDLVQRIERISRQEGTVL
ncbi:amino acid adenylation domain-containing protein [Micromonospora profundi]|uniref:non-ribosomal peptide synthetase n=1 Tax=Micromonospora profundi TaxID=1420889 RepID=UPI0033AFD76F